MMVTAHARAKGALQRIHDSFLFSIYTFFSSVLVSRAIAVDPSFIVAEAAHVLVLQCWLFFLFFLLLSAAALRLGLIDFFLFFLFFTFLVVVYT